MEPIRQNSSAFKSFTSLEAVKSMNNRNISMDVSSFFFFENKYIDKLLKLEESGRFNLKGSSV